MKRIISAENQVYKNVSRLGTKKFREKQGQYLIEGPNLMKEALQCETAVIHGVLFAASVIDENKTEIRELAQLLEEREIPTFCVEDKLFGKISGTETPQGVLAIADKPFYDEAAFFASREGRNSNIIVIDRLQDPGNIGAILRTADGAGFQGAIVLKGSSDVFSPKIVRAAAGTLFRLPILIAASPEAAMLLLKKNNKTVVCTSLTDAEDYYKCPLAENVAIVIGNEGNGVCEEFLNNADLRVKIPMFGSIESLNAAVAAGILIYESMRK